MLDNKVTTLMVFEYFCFSERTLHHEHSHETFGPKSKPANSLHID
jgi:hypothetical protein